MTDMTTEQPKKIHWATQLKLDREAAIAAGREPPPWPQGFSKASLKTAKIETKIETHKKQLAEDFLDGLTPQSCCDACNPEKGCVITGDMCGHPHKSGLQAMHRMKPDVMARYAKAKARLAHLAVDKRTG